MLTINIEIICNIIAKAREINIAVDILPDEVPDDVSLIEWKQILAEYQNDLSYIELKRLIMDLEPDQQQQIVALMYIGRGDFTKDEWLQAMEQAKTIRSEYCADYLIAKSMLADYLEEGLATYGYSCEE